MTSAASVIVENDFEESLVRSLWFVTMDGTTRRPTPVFSVKTTLHGRRRRQQQQPRERENREENTETSSNTEASSNEDSYDTVDAPAAFVRFTDAPPKIYRMVCWSFAYRNARRGPWERAALDRTRFRERIRQSASIINPCLQTWHRQHMLESRFENVS